VTIVPGGSTFDSAESFAMIRGGHIDVSVLGVSTSTFCARHKLNYNQALEVSANGDLANFMIPGKVFKGMGGAMDLVGNPDQTKIVVATDHVAKDGSPKIVEMCSLPLTGARCVSTIITDLVSDKSIHLTTEQTNKWFKCVFEVDRAKGGLTLTELAPGVEVEEIKKKTGAKFAVAEDIKSME
jgi:3-oxoacid CoA-transferase